MPKTVDLLTKNDFLGATSENQLYNKDGEAITGMGLYKYFNENGDYTGGLYADKDATKKILRMIQPAHCTMENISQTSPRR